MSAIDLSAGSLFAGQFRIVRPLAKGGMGAVYVVEQTATGRERALKLMHPALVSDAKSIERFEREARVGSRIESEHVVEVIAAGVEPEGPTPWLCMELLAGETLADHASREGPLPPSEVIQILRQLAHALSAAHRAGIVHRDLKPENLFLAESRREGVPFTLKVLDFGVAALAGASAVGIEGAKTTQAVGSPLWMAPEQTKVGKVTPATDVWALGLIAFQLLTGASYWRSPRSESVALTALLVEILVEPLEPASVRARELGREAALPQGFDAWFARAVAREPADRFADAGEAFPPLLELLAGRSSTSPVAFAATTAAPTGPSALFSPPVPPPATRTLDVKPERLAAIAAAPSREAPTSSSRGLAGGIALGLAAALALFVGYRALAPSSSPEAATLAVGPDASIAALAQAPSPPSMEPIAQPTAQPIAQPTAQPPAQPIEPPAIPDPIAPAEVVPEEERLAAPPLTLPIPSIRGREDLTPDPRARVRRAPRTTVTPEQLAAFEQRVVRTCRSNLEGAPRTRFVVTIDGAIRVAPTTNQPQEWFARCVRMNAAESHQPNGTYVFSAP